MRRGPAHPLQAAGGAYDGHRPHGVIQAPGGCGGVVVYGDAMTDSEDTADQGGEGEAVTEVTVVETDLDGDGVTDVVEVTSVTGVDVDGDGEADIVEVSTISRSTWTGTVFPTSCR